MVGNTTANNVCRRCKKKRPEDEPMETARYRTCKPCREIERKLKRIKKAQLTGQTLVDDDELQRKKAQEIEQNIIQMARQVTSTMPQSDMQHLQDNVNNVDMSLHHVQQQQHLNAVVSAAVNAVNAVHQGPPQIHQYDQSRDSTGASHHQPLMPVQSSIDQKEIPIDESLLKQGTEEEDAHHPHAGGTDKASLTKSPILKSEASPSTAVTSTGEQTDYKPTHEQQNNNNNMNNNNNENKEQNEEDEEGEIEDDGAQGENKEHQAIDMELAAAAAAAAAASPTKVKDAKGVDASDALQYCLYCGTQRTISDNGRYNLCGNCVNNPLERSNVFDDFETYLKKIETGLSSDLHNLIFINKGCDDIPEFNQLGETVDERNNLADVVMALNENYINKIMERSGFRFSKSSSNFSVKPFPKSIKLLYKCKQDVKTIQRQQANSTAKTLKTEKCDSNFYVSYDVISKGLSIKFNHNTHTPYLKKLYTDEIISRVAGIAEKQADPKEGFMEWVDVIDHERNSKIRDEMLAVKEMVFYRDFGPLFKNYVY